MRRAVLLVAIAAQLTACSTGQSYPRGWSLIPDVKLNVAKGAQIGAADLVAGVVVLGVAYQVIDPMAPNWTISETRLAPDTVELELTMKRFHQGGDGEAMQVLRRRAEALTREAKAQGYQLTRYEEGLESNWIAQRHARGQVRLLADSGLGGKVEK